MVKNAVRGVFLVVIYRWEGEAPPDPFACSWKYDRGLSKLRWVSMQS